MKKWIVVLLALLVLFAGYLAQSTGSDAGKLNLKGVTFNTNLTTALEAAKAQGKPVFVYASSEYCGWCKKFEEETFTNQSVAIAYSGKGISGKVKWFVKRGHSFKRLSGMILIIVGLMMLFGIDNPTFAKL